MPQSRVSESTGVGARIAELHKMVESLKQLPASLRVIQRALAALEDRNSNNYRLERILRQDPAAAADVLRLANSPYFGVETEIHTISMAIAVIGRVRLETLLRHLIVSKLFYVFTGGSRTEKARKRAVAAGAACHRLAREFGFAAGEELRIGGLLHNIGQLALLSEFPERYRRVELFSADIPLADAEIAEFGVGSDVVSRWLLGQWNFPLAYVRAAEFWSRPEVPGIEPDQQQFVRLVHAGCVLGEAWVTGLDADDIAASFNQRTLEELGTKPRFLLPIYDTLAFSVEEIEQHL